MVIKIKNIVVGAGITGLTIAERLADNKEETVVIEKRNHLGGNCYDYFYQGNYFQSYGPHIFHTSEKEVFEYLSQFTDWFDYRHKVLAFIEGDYIPLPFNLNSIDKVFKTNEAKIIQDKLIGRYGLGSKINILDLRKESDTTLIKLAEYVYKKIFKNYTTKFWATNPDLLDPSIMGRVPVFISRDEGYFQNKYQGMPLNGFSAIFNKMVQHANIKIEMAVDYKKTINNYSYKNLFYTGPLDYFFDYKFGRIKYRRIECKFIKHSVSSYQKSSVINYPNNFNYIRTTECNKFLNIKGENTFIMEEYASWDKGFLAYIVDTEENQKVINKYKKEASKNKNLVLAGRLAECKYYDMDQAVKRGLEIIKNKFNK